MTIYLDGHASTPLDPDVLEAMAPYFREIHGNPHSSEHSVGWQVGKAVDSALVDIAMCMGCDVDELVTTSGATEANNLALIGAMRANTDKRRRRILISPIEHKSVLACAEYGAMKLGYQIDQFLIDNSGFIDLEGSRALFGEDLLIVSSMAVNNEIGTIQPVGKIAAMARACGALTHCDAAQAPCALDVSSLVSEVDLLSLSGHKMYGPQGIGLLFGRREAWQGIEPMMVGGGQQGGRRPGTVPVALTVGLAASIVKMKLARESEEFERIRQMTKKLENGLRSVGVPIYVNGPILNDRHPGNLNVCFPGVQAADLLMALQPRVAASTGSACTSGVIESSYVLSAIGRTREEAGSAVRFGIGRFTTHEEIDEAIDCVASAVARLA